MGTFPNIPEKSQSQNNTMIVESFWLLRFCILPNNDMKLNEVILTKQIETVIKKQIQMFSFTPIKFLIQSPLPKFLE